MGTQPFLRGQTNFADRLILKIESMSFSRAQAVKPKKV